MTDPSQKDIPAEYLARGGALRPSGGGRERKGYSTNSGILDHDRSRIKADPDRFAAARLVRVLQRAGRADVAADMISATPVKDGAEAGNSRAAPPGVHPEVADADLALAAGVTCCPPAVAARIFERLADGESLLAICKDPAMPARRTVLAWIERDQAFAAAYARARDHQADALDDEMAEVMADVRAGRIDPAAARVWLSGAQWRAAKLAPRRYGDSLNLKHSGGIAAMPIEVSFEQAARTAQAILDGLKEAS